MKLLIPFLLSIVIVGSAVMLSVNNKPSHSANAPDPEATEDHPESRAYMEWLQLRDPGTGQIPAGIHQSELAFAASIPSASLTSLSKESVSPENVWTARGPFNVGGRTRAVALDVRSEQTILAGGITGGMWRSDDGGGTWQRTTLPSQHPTVTCIAQDTRPGREDIWYYGTGEYRSNSWRFGNTLLQGDGIFKSTDGGRTWNALPATVSETPQSLDSPFEYVNDIVTNPSNIGQDEVLAACYGGIMRSTDGGAHWTRVLGEPENPTGYTTIRVSQSGVFYAAIGTGGATRGIFRSDDGINWTDISPGFWPDSCLRIVMDIAPSNDNVLYIAAETPGSGILLPGSYGFPEHYSLWKYTYVSGDGSGTGGIWNDRSTNIPNDQTSFNSLHSYCFFLKVAPGDENTVYLGGTNIYRSTNGFASNSGTEWLGGYHPQYSYLYTGALHPDQHALIICPSDPDKLIVANDGGLYYTTNPNGFDTYWESLNNGFVNGQFYTIAIDQSTPGSDFLMGGLQDNGTYVTSSTNPKTLWEMLYGGDGSFCAVADAGQTLYLSSQNGNVLGVRINAPGDTIVSYVRPAGLKNPLFVLPFVLDPSDDNIMYFLGGPTIWRNSNLSLPSTNWNALTNTTGTDTITAIGVSRNKPQHRVYYGTHTGHLFTMDNAHTGNPQPIEITGPDFPRNAYINCIAVDPHNADRALVVFTNYNVQSLFLTTDAGATWTAVGGNLEESSDGTGNGPSCRWAAFAYHGSRSMVLVATSTGLYSTEAFDGESTFWRQEGAETIGNVRVDMIQTRESDGLIAVGTWGRGAFTTTLTTLGVETGSRGEEKQQLLMKNYPDPVQTTTTIDYYVPAGLGSPTVTLDILDMMGRQVALLVNEPQSPGKHTLRFDISAFPLSSVPDGAYFYRLRCGNTVETRRMMIVR